RDRGAQLWLEQARLARLDAPAGGARRREEGGAEGEDPADPRRRKIASLRTTLVSIPTETWPLDGVFYEPASGPITGAVLLFHGNTMNFHVATPRFLPPRLTELG